jgi:hypothetical protein
LQGRSDAVRELLRKAEVSLHVLRLTKAGHPGHPLYVAGDTVPTLWV